ncbi:MAG TPA: hypothetical protein PK095_01675 [Myxococcota bacterium]|nr:hypothetical protein [Myxococcota bacterium]
MSARVDLRSSGGKIARGYADIKAALSTPFEVGSLELERYADEDVARARRFWSERMKSEHRSVAVFGQLAVQLIEANAPLDMVTVAFRMAQDELVHTEVCGRVLEALGAEAVIERDIGVEPMARHEGFSPLSRALRNVIYTTCLSEMVAVARLADSLERSGDGVRPAIRAILADEVMHGQFGFLALDALKGRIDDGVRQDLESYLPLAFGVLERELVGFSRDPSPGAVELGVIESSRAREVFYGVIAEAIVPGLEARGLAAARAWRERLRA